VASAELPARLKPLDGLRGIAIVLVMLVHFGRGTHPNPLVQLLFKMVGAGWTGVDLFFVLSGFLITRILLATRGSPQYFRDFYMRRVLRIFPLTYGVLAAVLLVAPLVTHAPPPAPGASPIWLWLYANNIYPLVTGAWCEVHNVLGLNFGHFWSLAVEEQFYLLWPLIVWRLDRRGLGRLCVILACCCLSLRLAFVTTGVSPDTIYCFTLCRMDALLAGAFVAIVADNGLRWETRRRQAGLAALGSLTILVAAMAVTGTTFWPGRFMQTAGYSLLALFFGAVLVLAVTAPPGSRGRRLLEGRVLTFFGKYSYGLYVFHAMFWPAFDRGPLAIAALTSRLGSYLLAVVVHATAASAISIAVAVLSWHLYEKQFLKLKRYFDYRGAPVPALAVATAPRPSGG
jgi:peptidoglycan/LPS O-acetylase OafA/YrhL